jgi:hypothetical protein
MARFSFASLLHGIIIATAAVGLSWAAPAAPAEDTVPGNSGPFGSVLCGEEIAPNGGTQPDDPAGLCEPRGEEDDRAYLLQTASPGGTMILQGPEFAIARLNPEFVTRLASAIRDARDSGLPSAGIFSAYRPPVFGVGGFGDKFKSLHSYGLAVDMSGIGDPGSKEAKLWHEIAARHGIFCPYGFDSRTEWNHCQATPIKSVVAEHPLRKTITAQGPIELAEMFKVGSAVIDNLPAATDGAVAANRPNEAETIRPHVVHALASTSERLVHRPVHEARNRRGDAFAERARKGKTKTKLLALAMDTRRGERSRSKAALEPKTHESRRAARAAESHHGPVHHRSHLA